MLAFKQTEIESQIAQLQEQLGLVKLRLQQIAMEGKMPDYEVVLKTVKSQKVDFCGTQCCQHELFGCVCGDGCVERRTDLAAKVASVLCGQDN